MIPLLRYFFPNPSQRILALCLDVQEGFSVMKVETLLRLAGERAGEIQWREWSPHLSPTSLRWGETFIRLHAILGFRILIVLCLLRTEWLYMPFGCVRFQSTWLHESLPEERQLSQGDGTESEGNAFEPG